MEHQWFYPPLPNSPEEQIWAIPKTNHKEWCEQRKIFTPFEIQVAAYNLNFYRQQVNILMEKKKNFEGQKNSRSYGELKKAIVLMDSQLKHAEFYYYKTIGLVEYGAKNWQEHWNMVAPKPIYSNIY